VRGCCIFTFNIDPGRGLGDGTRPADISAAARSAAYGRDRRLKEVRRHMKSLKKLGMLCAGVAFLLSLLIPAVASATEPLPPIYPPPPYTPLPVTTSG